VENACSVYGCEETTKKKASLLWLIGLFAAIIILLILIALYLNY